jgi:hypothetical protein
MQKEKRKSNGGLWKKTNQYGEYFSGQLEIEGVKYNFVAYVNRYKDNDRKPDYQLYLTKPQTESLARVPSAIQTPMPEDDLPF